MKITTKGRYAIHILYDLAVNGTEHPVSVKEMATRQEISVKYTEQIISVLNKAGYVRSTRGPQGGYSLRKAPEEYTVGDILRLTEGSLAPVACVEEEGSCEREVDCVTVEVWKRLNQAISDVVDHITLADLVALQEEKREKSGLDFGKDI